MINRGEQQPQRGQFDDTEPLSGVQPSDHSQVRSIQSLFQSGEYAITTITDRDLHEKARHAITCIRFGNSETPLIPILAEDQLSRIIGTIESLHGFDRQRILAMLDPSITDEKLNACILRNHIVYCRRLYLQDQLDRTRNRNTGWAARTMEQQLHCIYKIDPYIDLVQLLTEIHPDLVTEL